MRRGPGVAEEFGFSSSFDSSIDFCLWVLEVDGLPVPPFDHHPEGDHSLRDRGLTGDSWRTWLHAVVDAQEQLHTIENAPMWRAVNAQDQGTMPAPARFTEEERLLVRSLGERTPATLWTGEPPVGSRLASLWDQYNRTRAQTGRGGMDLQRPIEVPEFFELLAPYTTRLPKLDLYYVDYPGPVASAVPPTSVLLGVRGPVLLPAAYHTVIMPAVEQLAAMTR